MISDTKKGKAYNVELDDTKSKGLVGTKLGDEVNGTPLGLSGYTLRLTGGSDKSGVPMRIDVHGRVRPKIQVSKGPGYKPKEKGIIRRKRVRGNVITPDIIQVNSIIVKRGKKSIDKILSASE
ncbi:MAG: 30S ribosomal protein S6e [Candidatus Hydrothermarchaeales archaeon]